MLSYTKENALTDSLLPLCPGVDAGVGLSDIYWLPPLCPLEILPHSSAKETKVGSHSVKFNNNIDIWCAINFYLNCVHRTASILVTYQISVKMATRSSLSWQYFCSGKLKFTS